MSGFIYVWRDKKHNRYYVGSHWGSEDDGYICSSTWMRNAYKRRPRDFKRRIIARIESSRNDLLIEEYRWLQMIEKEDLGKKFYNLTNHLNGHWFASDEDRRLSISDKISKQVKKAHASGKFEASKQLRIDALKRRRYTDKMRQVLIDRNKSPKTEEQRKNMKRTGEQNVWTGTMWINDGSTNQRVSKDTSIPAGFIKGRINVHKK